MIPFVLALLLLGPERTIHGVQATGGFAVARSKQTTMFAWSDGARVHVAPASLDWTLGPTTTLSTSIVGATATGPSIASDGEGFLVAWMERVPPTTTYVAMRVDARGQPSSVLPVFIGRVVNLDAARPDVVWSNGGYVVRWSSQFARLDARGLLLSPFDDTVRPSSISFAIASNGETQLIVRQRVIAAQSCHPSIFGGVVWTCGPPTTYGVEAELRGRTTILTSPSQRLWTGVAASASGWGFAAAHADAEALTVIGVSPDGRFSAPRVVTRTAFPRLLALAGGGDRWMAVWSDTAFRGSISGGAPFLIADQWPLEAVVLEIGDAFAVIWGRSGQLVVRDTIQARRRPAG